MTTQVEIAGRCGLDVSSVNKILNKIAKYKFRKETIKTVFRVAKELGYKYSSASKGVMRSTLEGLFPNDVTNNVLVVSRGVELSEIVRIKKMLYGEPDFKL